MHISRNLTFIALALTLFASCQRFELMDIPQTDQREVLKIRGVINQEYLTRANDDGFVDGDKMGIFVADALLQQTYDNAYARNIQYTYDQASGLWNPATDVYWLDSQTSVNIYGYYPFANNVNDLQQYEFEVQPNQNTHANAMSSYEASDFLYASSLNIPPLTKNISLVYHHIMAGIKVEILMGEGFTAAEFESLSKNVVIDNVLRRCKINLVEGSVTPIGKYDSQIVMGDNSDGTYRAILIPQVVSPNTPIIEVAIGDHSYSLSKSESTTFFSGKLHYFTIVVNKRAGGDYELSLNNEKILPWENDEISHSFETNSYVVVHCEERGNLEECIRLSGLDYSEIQNLKITGEINEIDYQFIREKMQKLNAINLQNVISYGIFADENENYETRVNMLPNNAFDGLTILSRIILPEKLEIIGHSSLSGTSLRGYIRIPNSVWYIGNMAIAYIETSQLMSFNIPSQLKYIGDSAFQYNHASFEFTLPNTVEHIGAEAFNGAHNAFGVFNVPTSLRYLGESAFAGLGTDMTGDIEIPSNLKKIPFNAFSINFKNGCRVYMNEGLESIGKSAFQELTINNTLTFPSSLTDLGLDGWGAGTGTFFNVKFRNGIVMPQNITYIAPKTFEGSNISGTPKIPEGLMEIPSALFRDSQITGIELSESIECINSEAFMRCKSLKSATIGKNVNFIGKDAFSECDQLQVVVCKAKVPPIADDAFNSLSWEHVVLEVPEESISMYRNSNGWNNFHAITPHKELSVNIPFVQVLNHALSTEGIVRAEDPWSVIEAPEWCVIEPTSSEQKKTLINISVEALAHGEGSREGRIILKLKNYEYTVEIPVVQHDYEHKIGDEIILQHATSDHTPINIFIVGDGFGVDEIINGKYLEMMEEQMEYFFDIEPYRTYRDRFSVSTAITLSSQNGISDYTQDVQTQFETCNYTSLSCNEDMLKDFIVGSSSLIDEMNYKDALVILLANTSGIYGKVPMTDRYSLAICPISKESYPYDQRGVIQHYAGGQAFGRLGQESVVHPDFISHCQCQSCSDLSTFIRAKELGYYRNLSLSNKLSDLPWKHLIFDSRYSNYVDVFEGGYRHSRGVWRSESQSCMSTFIPYYNSISRQVITERIFELSDEEFNFEDFASKDKIDKY